MTQKELEKHLTEDCQKIEVECKLCEESFVKDQLNNFELHTCAINLNKKLVKEREAIEAAKKKLEITNAELTVETDKVKKLDDEIKEH
jgi:hypothetical protein